MFLRQVATLCRRGPVGFCRSQWRQLDWILFFIVVSTHGMPAWFVSSASSGSHDLVSHYGKYSFDMPCCPVHFVRAEFGHLGIHLTDCGWSYGANDECGFGVGLLSEGTDVAEVGGPDDGAECGGHDDGYCVDDVAGAGFAAQDAGGLGCF